MAHQGTGIELYDRAQSELHEIHMEIQMLDKFEQQGDLEAMESQISQLLQFVTKDREVELPGLQVYHSAVWKKRADLAYAYYERASPIDRICPLPLVDEFMTEAIRLAEGTSFRGTAVPPLIAHHGSLLWKMNLKTESIQKYEDMLRYWMRVDENFGFLSTARINNLEWLSPYYNGLQGILFEMNQPERSLIWFERSHTRDLMFLVTGDKDRQASTEFDMDNEKAWMEIQSISKGMGQDTVIFVVAFLPFGEVRLYLLYNGDLVRHVRGVGEACAPSKLVKSIQENEADSDLHDYYRIIVRPFENELERIQPKTLIFVPNKELCLVPFGAMMDEDDHYLIKRYALVTVSSLRLLKHCNMRREAMQRSTLFTALVLGNPTKDLHSATKEAETVASFLNRVEGDVVVNFLREGHATKALLPRSNWIHIASHGIVSPEFPEGALTLGLPEASQQQLMAASVDSVEFEKCLTGALMRASSSERLTGEDVVELAEQDLFQASAAVLSACSTGVGRVSTEGILALPRSFHIAGVPSVVISLWDVSDTSTPFLMEKLYAKLLEGMDIATALQKAAVEMIEHKDSHGELVYNVRQWAPFFVSGTPFTTL